MAPPWLRTGRAFLERATRGHRVGQAFVARQPRQVDTSRPSTSRAARPDTFEQSEHVTPCYQSITQYYRSIWNAQPPPLPAGPAPARRAQSRRPARRRGHRVRRPWIRRGVDPAHRRTGRGPPAPDQLPLHLEGAALAVHRRPPLRRTRRLTGRRTRHCGRSVDDRAFDRAVHPVLRRTTCAEQDHQFGGHRTYGTVGLAHRAPPGAPLRPGCWRMVGRSAPVARARISPLKRCGRSSPASAPSISPMHRCSNASATVAWSRSTSTSIGRSPSSRFGPSSDQDRRLAD